jgi:hypothetical protein
MQGSIMRKPVLKPKPQTGLRTVDMSRALTDLDGNAVYEPVAPGDAVPRMVPTTLGRICARALVEYVGNAPADPVDKIKWFTLAQRIVGAQQVELSPEEIALLKGRVCEAFGVLVVGQACAMLDAA